MNGYDNRYDMEMVMIEDDEDDVFTEQWRRWRRPYWWRPRRRRYYYRPWRPYWRRW
ncbi:MAG: hypothetical protein HPY50_11375 [Firmicutes bacterium]|nr:hypothetical protein [Bacillota bacterium]